MGYENQSHYGGGKAYVCVILPSVSLIPNFTQVAKEPPSCDDKEGHYIIEPNDMLIQRCMLPFSKVEYS